MFPTEKQLWVVKQSIVYPMDQGSMLHHAGHEGRRHKNAKYFNYSTLITSLAWKTSRIRSLRFWRDIQWPSILAAAQTFLGAHYYSRARVHDFSWLQSTASMTSNFSSALLLDFGFPVRIWSISDNIFETYISWSSNNHSSPFKPFIKISLRSAVGTI